MSMGKYKGCDLYLEEQMFNKLICHLIFISKNFMTKRKKFSSKREDFEQSQSSNNQRASAYSFCSCQACPCPCVPPRAKHRGRSDQMQTTGTFRQKITSLPSEWLCLLNDKRANERIRERIQMTQSEYLQIRELRKLYIKHSND